MAGRQLKLPVLVLSVAPAGPFCREKVIVCGGVSVSVTLHVKLTTLPAMTVRLVMAARMGAVLDTGALVVVIKMP